MVFPFHFHFLSSSPFEVEQVIEAIRRNLRSFVGVTAFEELARFWLLTQAKAGLLPFAPDNIGSYWSSRVQVDAVALNWKTHDILLGECKWGTERVDRQVVRELIEKKTPLILRELPNLGEGWRVHYALFARSGFTPAAVSETQLVHGSLITLQDIDETLGHLV